MRSNAKSKSVVKGTNIEHGVNIHRFTELDPVELATEFDISKKDLQLLKKKMT